MDHTGLIFTGGLLSRYELKVIGEWSHESKDTSIYALNENLFWSTFPSLVTFWFYVRRSLPVVRRVRVFVRNHLLHQIMPGFDSSLAAELLDLYWKFDTPAVDTGHCDR